MSTKRLEEIYRRGLKSLDDYHNYKPLRTVSQLRQNKDGSEEDVSEDIQTQVVATEPKKARHPWRQGMVPNKKVQPVRTSTILKPGKKRKASNVAKHKKLGKVLGRRRK